MSTSITCALLVGLACVCLCQQVVDEAVVERAVSQLAKNFRTLRSDQIGVEVLQDEFRQYTANFGDVLDEESIRSLLTNSTLQDLLAEVTSDLNEVLSIGLDATNETIVQCCNGSSSPCCYSCSSGSNSLLFVEGGDIFSSFSAIPANFYLGLSDGRLLVHPSPAPPAGEECTELDSRLQPWYVVATADQPRAVAIIVDFTTGQVTPTISAAVGDVIKSLSPNDLISVTPILGNTQPQSVGNLYTANTCRKTELLEMLANPQTPFQASRAVVLEDYVKLLNSSSVTDRILMFVSDTNDTSTNGYDFDAVFISDVSPNIIASDISLQVYLTNALSPQDPLNVLLDGLNISARNLTDISGYYSHLIRPGSMLPPLQATTTFNSNGELSLSISGIRLNAEQSEVVGVVNAQLSWKTLLQSVDQSLVGRLYSYLFIVDSEGNIWYHDHAPDLVTYGLSPSLFEPEEAFSNVLDAVKNGSESTTIPVTKVVLLPRTGELEGSYLLKHLPATYNCWRLVTLDGEMSYYTCLLLAEEDVALITSREAVDVSEIYSTTPLREPILHSTIADLSDSSCSYFCHPSTNDHISLQLTSPIETLASDAEITAYISGSGPLPDGIPSGIAEEVGVLSSVAEKWLRGSRRQPTSLLHRHLATPTGVYLRYPPLSLSDAFNPQELAWYHSAVSQVDALTLSPPSMDIVDTNRKVYSSSWPIRDNNMQLLAVLAATSTISSLRVDVNTALNGLCNQPGYDCMIINDEGFFVLNPLEFPDASYLVEVDSYVSVFANLLGDTQSSEGSFLLQKRGCNDFENGGYNQFYWLNRANGNVTCGTTSTYNYCIQNIPESNAFLLVVKTIGSPSSTCFGSRCLDCPKFSETSVSCFCNCAQEMCSLTFTDSDVFTPCPASRAVDPNYELASTAQYQGDGFCWDASQCCSEDQSSCESLATCSWCSESASCIPIGTCCSDDGSCCFSMPPCFLQYCSTPGTNSICSSQPTSPTSPTPSPSMEVSDINTEAAIIGGVVGGIFAVFLLAMLIVCCVWYQIYRAPIDEDHKEKGVFDLTGIRADATNQTAIEISNKSVDQPASPEENGGNTVKHDLSAEKIEGTQL